MIQVDRLSKRYGSYKAVESIRFDIGRGEIVGLLGPNGAGKTTTMRMLTTYLSPTSGRASLAGHDVLDEPLEVRRSVGYLPENVPLYHRDAGERVPALSGQPEGRSPLGSGAGRSAR